MHYFYFIIRNKELKNKYNAFLLIIFSCLFIPSPSTAGSYKISPVKIQIDSKTKATVIEIANQSDEKVTLQLSVKNWSQTETSSDKYEETKDIVFFPKIVTLEKGEERTIRIGYQGKGGVTTEKTYRLFIEELPVVNSEETTLSFALNFVVPIYVHPLKEFKEPSVEKIQLSHGKLAVKVKNSGNVHFIVGKITVIGFDSLGGEVFQTSSKGRNILAGASRTFDIALPEEGCIKAEKARVNVEVDGTTMREDFILNKIQCGNKNENKKVQNGPLK